MPRGGRYGAAAGADLANRGAVGPGSRTAHDSRMIGLLEDEVKRAMAEAEDTPLVLPMPDDERALAVARYLLETPVIGDSIDGPPARFDPAPCRRPAGHG